MTNPITKSIILLGLQLSLLACTATQPTQEPGQTAETPNTAKAPGGISGVILSASDVSGYPDVPLSGQLILAVPFGKAEEILGSGASQLEERKLRLLKVNLPGANPAIQMTVSDSGGNYSLPLEPGDYIVCVVDLETTPPSLPARTRGCGRAQVSPGELRRIDISSGFGEILLQPR